MEEPHDGRLSGVLALLGQEAERISVRGRDHPPVLSKDEIDSELGADSGSELLYLRDENMVYIQPDGIYVNVNPTEIEVFSRLAEELDLHYGNSLDAMVEEEHRSEFMDYPETLEAEEPVPADIEFSVNGPERYLAVLYPFGKGVEHGLEKPQHSPEYVANYSGLENPERELDFMTEWGFLNLEKAGEEWLYTLVDENLKEDARITAQYIDSAYDSQPTEFVDKITDADLENLDNAGVRLGYMMDEMSQ